jgi:hypothetical protein
MAYDPSRERVVACNTWGTCEWDGESWSVIAPGGVGAFAQMMFYDTVRRRLTAPLFEAGGYVTPDAWTLDPTSPPVVVSQPAGAVLCGSHSLDIGVWADGTLLRYQWRRNGVALDGQMSPTLRIEHPGPGDLGTYTCVVSNACGSVVSAGARLVAANDYDGDGAVGTDADIQAFFACLAGECCPTCGGPDFDGDGQNGTDADIAAFFLALAGEGC